MNARMTLVVLLAGACNRAPHGESTEPPRPVETPAPSASAAAMASAASTPPSVDSGFSETTWHYDTTPLGSSDVVVLVPRGATREAKLPVAFHGRGESLKGPKLGARGWIDDYTLGTTVKRLVAPPLVSDDFLGFVTGARLGLLNTRLAAHPYRGLIVVCPFLPDALHGDRGPQEGEGLARFVVDTLLPRVRAETPAIGTPETTGVDGVSLGGRAALFVGLSRPEAFGALGALQPAIDGEETSGLADLGKRAHEKNPKLVLRLLTSNGDYFLEPTLALAHALDARSVPNRVDVVTGPHSYDFNRGPGGYEMLLFHDAALRGERVE
jgi:enterochelin esterase-like enzyme